MRTEYVKSTASRTDVGDPYLPFRDVMAMLSGDVESKWDAGAITRDHAQRLWAALPLVVQALLDHGPDVLDVLVAGEAVLSRAEIAAQAEDNWLPRLRAQVKGQAQDIREVDQTYLFQQVTNTLRSVAQQQPLLLIIDDLQWADVASISLLFHLGRRLAGADSRVLIICAYRPEEVAMTRPVPSSGQEVRHSLARVLSEFKRSFGDVWVELGQTNRTEGRRFVDALLDAEPNRLAEVFRATLFQRTEGHALFTVELLRSMQERGDLRRDADGYWTEGQALDWQALPARVEAVVAERIGRLDPELQDMLAVASVEGEVFTGQVVTQVQEMAVRPGLQRLSQELERRHRLVGERDEVQAGQRRLSRYRFGHVLFRDYLYGRLSRGEKRLLHGDVAAALEDLYSGQLGEMAVQLAHHYQQAGDDARAYRYLTMAAERAVRLYARDEAVAHYTQAINMGDRVSVGSASRAGLYRGRGLAREALGDFDGARADHEFTHQLAIDSGYSRMEWQALLDLGKLWGSRDYHRARDFLEQALELARPMDDPQALSASLNWMGNWHANAEESQAAVAYHLEALEIVEKLGNEQDLANTLDLLALAYLLGGNLTASVSIYDRAIALSRELNDLPRLISGLIARAVNVSDLIMLASVPAMEPPDALGDLERAIGITREIGSVSDEAWAHWALGHLHIVQGRYGPAMEVIQRGLRLASTFGHREYEVTVRTALGNLYLELLMPEEAGRELAAALAQARELRSQLHVHRIAGALAAAHTLLDDLSDSQACLEAVLSRETGMDTVGNRYCWARRAELALAQGDPGLALDLVERLVASAPGMSPGRVITYLWKLKGQALASMGDLDGAQVLLNAAMENAKASGERFLLWRLHASMGQVFRALGRQPEVEKELSAAYGLVEDLASTLPPGKVRASFLQRTGDYLRSSPW